MKLQGRYEIQILNTPAGRATSVDGAGAIQGRKAPDSNASLGEGHWQRYDIDFTAARWDGNTKLSDARVTVHWNGVLVHDDVAMPQPTGASPAEAPGFHPILLQAHSSGASGPVQFRNVWVIGQSSPLIPSTPAEYWNRWIDLAELEGSDREPWRDPDGDTQPTIWEYVSGGNPKAPDLIGPGGESRAPAMALVEEGGELFAEFTFLRRADHQARGLVFHAETSTTLEPDEWTSRAVTLVAPPQPVGDGTYERVKVRVDDLPMVGEPRMFIRFRTAVTGG